VPPEVTRATWEFAAFMDNPKCPVKDVHMWAFICIVLLLNMYCRRELGAMTSILLFVWIILNSFKDDTDCCQEPGLKYAPAVILHTIPYWLWLKPTWPTLLNVDADEFEFEFIYIP
jgi:hypothetical protein